MKNWGEEEQEEDCFFFVLPLLLSVVGCPRRPDSGHCVRVNDCFYGRKQLGIKRPCLHGWRLAIIVIIKLGTHTHTHTHLHTQEKQMKWVSVRVGLP